MWRARAPRTDEWHCKAVFLDMWQRRALAGCEAHCSVRVPRAAAPRGGAPAHQWSPCQKRGTCLSAGPHNPGEAGHHTLGHEVAESMGLWGRSVGGMCHERRLRVGSVPRPTDRRSCLWGRPRSQVERGLGLAFGQPWQASLPR